MIRWSFSFATQGRGAEVVNRVSSNDDVALQWRRTPPHRDAVFANAVPTVRAMTVSSKPSVTDPNTHAHAYDAASECARSATRAASSSMTMPASIVFPRPTSSATNLRP